MKKLLYFVCLFAYLVGAIGGFGYALHSNAIFIAVCVVVLAAMAWPTTKSFYEKLTQ